MLAMQVTMNKQLCTHLVILVPLLIFWSVHSYSMHMLEFQFAVCKEYLNYAALVRYIIIKVH